MRLQEMFALPCAFALIGYLFTTKKMILFLNTLTPFQGLLFYYFQLFTIINVLQCFGLVIGSYKMTTISQSIGELLIIFSFFIIVNFESYFVQWSVDSNTKKDENKSKNCTTIYLQSEDGATYDLVDGYLNNPPLSRIITFIVVPFVLTFLGTQLITHKISLSVF